MDEMNVYISIDIRKFRIRIYKATLQQIGSPKFIQLLVSPEKRSIAIQGHDQRCMESHEVSFTKLKPDDSYELYSKQLIQMLFVLLPQLGDGCTYRLTGNAYATEQLAIFPLDTMRPVEGGN